MKDNANPTIYSVRRELDFSEGHYRDVIQKFDLNNRCNDQYSTNDALQKGGRNWLPKHPTPELRSVHMALSYIDDNSTSSTNEGYDSLSLLKRSGMKPLHTSSHLSDCFKRSFFEPFPTSSSTHIPSNNKQSMESHSVQCNSIVRKRDLWTQSSVFDIIRNIQDPEHPLTLEQLKVVNIDHIKVVDNYVQRSSAHEPGSRSNDGSISFSKVEVRLTPTIPHCSMATLIGLSIRVKLLRSLPKRFKITVRIQPGTHASEHAINKQLADKERVSAALENNHLLDVVNRCIENGMKA